MLAGACVRLRALADDGVDRGHRGDGVIQQRAGKLDVNLGIAVPVEHSNIILNISQCIYSITLVHTLVSRQKSG